MDLYSFPLAYRGLTLNEHRTAAGALDATKEADTIRVDRFDFSRLQQRDQREPLNLLTGGDLGDASPTFRYLSLAGMVKGSNGMKLSDKIAALLAAFNVEEAQLASPTTVGLLPLTFTDVTEVNTGRGTAWTDPTQSGQSGYYVVERFLARPAGWPIITQRRSGGDSAGFALELVCADPRRYIDTAESVVLNSGNGFSASCPNWNTTQGWAVPPTLTIVTSANGSATFTFAIADGIADLVLNLSAVGAATIVVDCAAGTIKIGSTHRADLRTSVVDSLFKRVPRGGATAAASNTTNVTSVTLAYRQARG